VKRFIVALIALCEIASSASAWNNKGHMVVARVAWNELKPEEQAKVIDILNAHPHYEEFLKGQRPLFPEDERVFLRGGLV
jgi:hypothetical protein